MVNKMRIEHKGILDTLKTVYANFLNRMYNGFFDNIDVSEDAEIPSQTYINGVLNQEWSNTNTEYITDRMAKLNESIANGSVKETVRGTSLRNASQSLNNVGKTKLKQEALDRATSMSDTVKEEMKNFFKDVADKNLSLAEAKDLLKQKFRDKITEGKADTIARTEYRSAYNYGQNNAIEQLTEKGIKIIRVWRTSGSNTRETHQIDGEEAEVGEQFSNGLLYPMEDGAPPEEVINCDCYIEIREITND